MTVINGTNVPTTELDKQKAIIDSGAAGAVQDFMDWLSEQGYILAKYSDQDSWGHVHLYDATPGPEQLMADHFGIDRDKIEQERRALLTAIQEQS